MDPVVVNVAFSYAATYVMPKKRKAEAGYFRATAPLLVPVCTEEEAPVVCRARSGRGAERPTETVVRHHAGRFWRPLTEDDGRTPFTLARLREAAAGARPWFGDPFLDVVAPRMDEDEDYHRRKGSAMVHALKTVEQTGVRELLRSEIGAATGRLAAAGDSFRVVDGVFHVPCGEPRLHLSVQHNWLTLAFVTEPGDDRYWVSETFRADRLAEARRYAALLAKSEGILRHGRIQPVPSVDCPRPDLLERRDLVEAARRHAPKLMEKIARHLAALPDGAVMAFLRMRAAAATLAGDGADDACARRFCEDAADIARVSAVERESGKPGSWQLGEFADAAERLLTRWRTVEGGPPAGLAAEDEAALEAVMGGAP